MASGRNSQLKRRDDAWPQILVVLVVNVTALIMGMTIGFSGVALPEIRSDRIFKNITAQEDSWIASLPMLSFPLGSLVGGGTVEYFGRRMTILGSAIPNLVGWIMIAVGSSVELLYAGRFATGFSMGIAAGAQQVYVAEISETYLRGILGSSLPVGLALGTFLEYLFSIICTWRELAAVGAGFSALQLILTWFIPETPVWLITAGKHEKAKEAMQKLRGPAFDTEAELSELLQHQTDTKQAEQGQPLEQQAQNAGKVTVVADTVKKLLVPQIIKPFFILVILFFTQVYCGSPAMVFYLADIFHDAGAGVDTTTSTLITGAVRVLLTAMTPVLLWKMQNRKLLIHTGWPMTIPLVLLGTFHFLAQPNHYPELEDMAYTNWIPTMCILIFFVFNTPGFGTLPWCLLAELFPSNLRGLLSALITFIVSLLMFSIIKGYPFILESMGKAGTFWFFGAVSLAGTIFVMVCLPETKDMTLDEIEEYFSKGGSVFRSENYQHHHSRGAGKRRSDSSSGRLSIPST